MRERGTTFVVVLIVGAALILFGIAIALTYLGGGSGGITQLY
jgi:hypothetical protein